MFIATKRMLMERFGLSRREAIEVHKINAHPGDPHGLIFQTEGQLLRAVDQVRVAS